MWNAITLGCEVRDGKLSSLKLINSCCLCIPDKDAHKLKVSRSPDVHPSVQTLCVLNCYHALNWTCNPLFYEQKYLIPPPSCAFLDQCTLKNVSYISSGNIFNVKFYFEKTEWKNMVYIDFFWQTSICILLECIHTLFWRMKVRKAFWHMFKNATTSRVE